MNRNTIRLILSILVISLLAFTQAMAGPVPDTGQTQSYTDTFGEDSDYTINPPSYTKLDAQGNDLPDDAAEWVMVRDNVTGLIWEVKTDDGSIHDKDNKYTWTDMGCFIDVLNSEKFGGYSDWRMPNREELRSIVDCGRYKPAIDAGYFPNTVSSNYWSSSIYANSTYRAWSILFNYGGDVSNGNRSYSYYVRAVRGGQSGSFGNLVINGDGTVTDISTGLMWQQVTAGNMTWEAAIVYCEELLLGGHSDWRMPTFKELASIADLGKYNPAIDAGYFPNTVSSDFWSSTTRASYTGRAWLVNFGYGSSYYYDKYSSYYVRAVRGGQSRLLGYLVLSAPEQASRWEGGSEQVIIWDTQGIEGNVRISLSRQGGKGNTFETISESTENDGSYEWTVTGAASFNCVMKIEPLNEPNKATTQGLFSIVWDTELSGIVTNVSTGNPIANVTVSTDDQGRQTNPQGYYVLGGLTPGNYDITFSKTGYQTVTISDVEIKTGEPTELNVSMAISLSGTVTDLSIGHPLSGVIVSTIDDQNTQTNSQGYYALGSLTPGTYDITFSKTGYQTVTISDVVIIAGQGTELNIDLTPPSLLNILTTDLPVSETGVEYNPRVRISGGIYPYTYSIA
ncbi:MAG: DUF1566 domain-containing protein [Thermodesulfobacteriota bacterium]|nr:DUF1566 domain-containing protein [Thermodesulfobacteriota bacterium]